MITFVNMKRSAFVNDIWKRYSEFRNGNLEGRYLTFPQLEPEIGKLGSSLRIEEIGKSEMGIPISAVGIGKGDLKILGWSQMHGNESTTTKALFDLFNLFSREKELQEISELLDKCSILFIPMLNPDGAEKYTRENLNGVDLNRDADKLTQIESRILRQCFEDFGPDFCFNLHDQRTIFSAGRLGKPATVSFLAPAMDEERTVNPVREKAMKVIVAMDATLQKHLPGQVGRYDDAFNINCSGDRFQAFGVPTILFEAGHSAGDYEREETRKYIFLALLSGIHSISTGSFEMKDVDSYYQIPENQKDYCDILLKNVLVKDKMVDVAIQYEEKLRSGRLKFEPVVQIIQENIPLLSHRSIDGKGLKVRNLEGEELSENDLVTGILLNRDNISFKIE